MRRSRFVTATLLVCVGSALLLPGAAAATSVSTSYVCPPTAGYQDQADIDDNMVVYATKAVGGDWEIAWGEVDTATHVFLPYPYVSIAGSQTHPAISGDWIVWQDHRGANWDIYARNLTAPGVEVAVCTAPGNQTLPRLSGNLVVWQDHRGDNWDVYSNDVSSPAGNGAKLAGGKGDQTAPDVDGQHIVWVDTRSGDANIWAYDTIAVTTAALVTNGAWQDQPTVDGDRVVWRDFRHARRKGTDLYVHDFVGGTNKPLVTSFGNQNDPRLSDDMLVYTDYRNAMLRTKAWGADVAFYDLTLDEDFTVAAGKGSQSSPAIDGFLVLWTDSSAASTKTDVWAAEMTAWTATLGIDHYRQWTNDPLCDLELFALHKSGLMPAAITQTEIHNVGAFGPFPFATYAETVTDWDITAGVAATDGVKQVQVTYRDTFANTSAPVVASITLDRVAAMAEAVDPAKGRSGRTAKVRYRINDAFSPTSWGKIEIRNKSKVVKTVKLGWVPVGVWRTKSFACGLKPGTYHFSIITKDKAGNESWIVAVYHLKVTK